MNLAFPIGFIVCCALLILGIVLGNPLDGLLSFWDTPSLFITVGGTLAALFATFPIKQSKRVIQHLPILLGLHKQDPVYYINIMTELSLEARKKGLLALEDSVAQYDDAFLRDSVMLIVDSVGPDKIRKRLENELGNIEERHAQSWDIYDKGAALAPGFGMMGTLIGLINMLGTMRFEEEGGAPMLAQNMAAALVTTFYGVFLANVVFIPIATQLRCAHNDEMLCKEIIIEGVVSIQEGENPRHINEKLISYLTCRERAKAAGKAEASE